MKMMISNISANSPMDEQSADHPMVSVFYIYDLKSIVEYLSSWVEEMTVLVIRFTSDKDLSLLEEISQIRKLTSTWIENSSKLLIRNEKTTNGKDYIPLSSQLTVLTKDIEAWMGKLEMRVSGDDGTASQLMLLQNQVDDRYNSYSTRDAEKPLSEQDRQTLKDHLTIWVDMIGNLINSYANTTEREQNKIPLHVENWIGKILEHLNTDTDVRNEGNQNSYKFR